MTAKRAELADPTTRKEVMTAFDLEMIERGGNAVKQSLQEAEYSLDPKTVEKMLMAKTGLTKTA
jgi:hypothetical protein